MDNFIYYTIGYIFGINEDKILNFIENKIVNKIFKKTD